MSKPSANPPRVVTRTLLRIPDLHAYPAGSPPDRRGIEPDDAAAPSRRFWPVPIRSLLSTIPWNRLAQLGDTSRPTGRLAVLAIAVAVVFVGSLAWRGLHRQPDPGLDDPMGTFTSFEPLGPEPLRRSPPPRQPDQRGQILYAWRQPGTDKQHTAAADDDDDNVARTHERQVRATAGPPPLVYQSTDPTRYPAPEQVLAEWIESQGTSAAPGAWAGPRRAGHRERPPAASAIAPHTARRTDPPMR